MQSFTWHDIETEIFQHRNDWPQSWNRVDVYNDEVVINVSENNNKEEDQKFLKKVFGKFYNQEEIIIEFSQERLSIQYENGQDEERIIPNYIPLFKDLYSYTEGKLEDLEVPMIAFHSYKGGVGRTLSLIAMLKQVAEVYGDKKKVLVVDADIEAPGLTWMLNGDTNNAPISYLDVLGLLHINDMSSELIKNIVKLIQKSRFAVETDNLEVEEYFLPVYRIQEQMTSIFSTPEKIIASQSNKFIITEAIAKIGVCLGIDLILIDLRAGITEFSAPYLFDPRVEKYFVSSTSVQSVKGTKFILKEISEKVPSAMENMKVLLTMIPSEMQEDQIHQIEDDLTSSIEQEQETTDESLTTLREEYMIRIPFESPFISLGTFQEICTLLKGKNLSLIIQNLVKDMFIKSMEAEKNLDLESVIKTRTKLNALAESEITAEGNESSNMLSTGAIREIVQDYSDTIPKLVILGAKGSGKTYIYKQMVAKKNWGGFLKIVNQDADEVMDNALIVPLLCTQNRQNIDSLVKECIQNVNNEVPAISVKSNAVSNNFDRIYAASSQNNSVVEWSEIWRDIILALFGEKFKSFDEVSDYLETINKKIVFLIDGLEDVFMDSQTENLNGWKMALRALCQNIVNELRNTQKDNLGIVVLVRKDMAEEAIATNFEQFRNQYIRYELKWTPTEALRLALWIVSRVNPEFSKNIDILRASRDALEKKLELLWGRKLGKNNSREALSARWIIAALSDFNGQIQARDIIRFLAFISQGTTEIKFPYSDRFVMPLEVRRAIPSCSEGKYSEIKAEMKSIYQILRKFEDMTPGDKQLPLALDKINLTGEEIARLQSQGYLNTSDNQYYLPEIIRFALGFKYMKGARPKVLSLLTK